MSGPSVAQGAVARARVPGLALPRPVEAVDLVSSLELDSGRTSARARLRALAAAGGGNGGGSRQASARARGGDSSARAVAAVAGVSLTGAADTQAAPAVAVQPHAQPQATRPHSKSMPPLSQAAARASDLRAIAGSGDDPAAAEAAATQARRDAARQALLRREGRESFISRVGDTLDLPRQARYQLGTEQRRFMGGEATGEARASSGSQAGAPRASLERLGGSSAGGAGIGKGGSPATVTLDGGKGSANNTRRSSLTQAMALHRRSGNACMRCITFKSVLDPLSTFMRYWDLSSLVVLLFTSTVTPYEISFLEVKVDALFWFNRVVDFFFLCDIVVNFNLKFFDSHSGMWVKDRTRIRRRYMRTWFGVDVISFIPFDTINLIIESDRLEKFRGLRLLRLLRLAKLLRILRAGRVLERLESAFALDYVVTTMGRFMTLTILVCHWMACMWRFLPDIEDGTYSWLDAFNEHLVARDLPDISHHSEEYSAALYFAIYTLTSVGYGDVAPVTPAERYFAIFMMILGAYFFGYIVGSITAILTARNERETQFYQLMDELNSFSDSQHLPQDLRGQLREYFRYSHQTADTQMVHQLLKKMSPQLRNAVAQHINSGWMTGVSFFNGISHELCTEFSMAMTSHTFAPMELVISSGELAERLYVVRKGVVAADGRILSASGLNVLGVDMIANRDGTMMRHYDATALTWSVLLSLDRSALQAILLNYPEAQESMRINALRHIFRTEVRAYALAQKWLRERRDSAYATGLGDGSMTAARSVGLGSEGGGFTGVGVDGRADHYYRKLVAIRRQDAEEQRQIEQSALTIQRCWRGHRVRSGWRVERKDRLLAQRSLNNEEAIGGLSGRILALERQSSYGVFSSGGSDMGTASQDVLDAIRALRSEVVELKGLVAHRPSPLGRATGTGGFAVGFGQIGQPHAPPPRAAVDGPPPDGGDGASGASTVSGDGEPEVIQPRAIKTDEIADILPR